MQQVVTALRQATPGKTLDIAAELEKENQSLKREASSLQKQIQICNSEIQELQKALGAERARTKNANEEAQSAQQAQRTEAIDSNAEQQNAIEYLNDKLREVMAENEDRAAQIQQLRRKLGTAEKTITGREEIIASLREEMKKQPGPSGDLQPSRETEALKQPSSPRPNKPFKACPDCGKLQAQVEDLQRQLLEKETLISKLKQKEAQALSLSKSASEIAAPLQQVGAKEKPQQLTQMQPPTFIAGPPVMGGLGQSGAPESGELKALREEVSRLKKQLQTRQPEESAEQQKAIEYLDRTLRQALMEVETKDRQIGALQARLVQQEQRTPGLSGSQLRPEKRIDSPAGEELLRSYQEQIALLREKHEQDIEGLNDRLAATQQLNQELAAANCKLSEAQLQQSRAYAKDPSDSVKDYQIQYLREQLKVAAYKLKEAEQRVQESNLVAQSRESLHEIKSSLMQLRDSPARK